MKGRVICMSIDSRTYAVPQKPDFIQLYVYNSVAPVLNVSQTNYCSLCVEGIYKVEHIYL